MVIHPTKTKIGYDNFVSIIQPIYDENDLFNNKL